MVIEAKYENGVFKPLGRIKLKEGTLVEIHVNRGHTTRKAHLSENLVLLACGPTAPRSKMA